MTLYFDCSYTRTQQGSVGITRVVRNLARQLQVQPGQHTAAELIAFGANGFRLVGNASPVDARYESKPVSETTLHPMIRLFRCVTAGRVRTLITRYLPSFLQRPLYSLYSTLTFSQLSRGAPPVRFSPGDIVVLCDAAWNYPVWRCVRSARRDGARAVTIIYDLIPLNYAQYCSPLFTTAFRSWLHEALAFSDALICISRTTEEEVREYCRTNNLRLPPTSHFRLGSDLDFAAESPRVRDEVLRALDATSRSRCFISIGSIEPRKNHQFLLDAFEKIWAAHPEVVLIVAGRPAADNEATLARLATHPRRGTSLLVLFDATDDEIQYMYSRALALVFPSAVEGFGLPLVEARQRGCRVLASDIPVFRELADEGVRLFSLESTEQFVQQVLELLTQSTPARTEPMPLFSWENSASTFAAEIECLLEQH